VLGQIWLPRNEPRYPAGGGALPLSYNPFVFSLLLITVLFFFDQSDASPLIAPPEFVSAQTFVRVVKVKTSELMHTIG
jgi:hypothetical protein